MNLRLIVVSFLAVVLIGIYVISIGATIVEGERFNAQGMDYLFRGVGGLITAFAISFLALTPPNTVPTKVLKLTANLEADVAQLIQKGIPVVFVLTWLICGAAAVYFGIMKEPSIEALNETGKTWIGTVIAAMGAYWGIEKERIEVPE